LRTSSTHRAVVRTLRHWDASRITNEAQQISSPTLLIWGEHDADAPLSHGEYLHSSIPGSRLFVFRHCGHLPQEEYPLEFVEIVTNFLESDAKLASAGRYGSNDVLELDSMAG
jgi:pimeloyl-ACP methyl ester carboxylesterase